MKMRDSFSLNSKLIFGCVLMLSFSLLFSLSLIFIFKASYDRANLSLQSLNFYKQILVAANRLSAERGPTNALLGEETMTDSALHRKLIAFRKTSDAALEAVQSSSLHTLARPSETEDPSSVRAVRQQLLRARQRVDEVLAIPLAQRTPEDITDAIRGMFGVIDAIRPMVSTAIARIVAQEQVLAGPALMAEILGDLREYAGRLSSQIMPYIAVHKPLPVSTIDELNTIRGRISELWLLAASQAGLYSDDERLATARHDVVARFFGVGLPLVYATAETGRATGEYGITTAELSDRFVATFEPVERIRSVFLDLTIERSTAARGDALNRLIAVSVITGLCVLANVALILAARRRIFLPLLKARDQIIALSEGRETDEPAGPALSNDIKNLFQALEDLRVRLSERLRYTELLKIQAATDGLTGLMNRRSLERIGEDDANMPETVGLIMMDLDHFKAINDTHGHPAGDRVLQRAAGIVRAALGETDLAVRYGGEEFAVVVTECDRVSTMDLAERIRAELERTTIEAPDGRPLRVTASFGVAVGCRRGPHWQSLVSAADGALYAAKCKGRNLVIQNVTEPQILSDAA